MVFQNQHFKESQKGKKKHAVSQKENVEESNRMDPDATLEIESRPELKQEELSRLVSLEKTILKAQKTLLP